MNMKITWENIKTVNSKSFNCGYCGNSVSSDKAFTGNKSDGRMLFPSFIYICHHCSYPTFFDDIGQQTPQKTFGENVLNINDSNIQALYEEARGCYSACAFTASTMVCRKLLMNLAVSKGAKENQSFQNYVDYLDTNNFIPNGTKDWIDVIRTQGNEATHEIALSTQDQAEEILSFTEMLLKLIYEFPNRALKYKK